MDRLLDLFLRMLEALLGIRKDLKRIMASLSDLQNAQAATAAALAKLDTDITALIAAEGTPTDFTSEVAAETALQSTIATIDGAVIAATPANSPNLKVG